jgi:hypothetical protein
MGSTESKLHKIIVAEGFEVKNGLLGLDRDIYLSIVKFLDPSILRKVLVFLFCLIFLFLLRQYIGISEESYERIKHIHFVIYILKCIIIYYYYIFFQIVSLHYPV